jgi:hypothetical protein
MIAATLLLASLIGEVSARAPDFATEIVPVLRRRCNLRAMELPSAVDSGSLLG